MSTCHYCRRDVDGDARTCGDCAEYEAAVRVASRVLQDSNVESGALAATLGAEIMREYFLRSIRGTRARDGAGLEAKVPVLQQRSLV